MFCANCGKNIKDRKVCPYCGAIVAEEAPKATPIAEEPKVAPVQATPIAETPKQPETVAPASVKTEEVVKIEKKERKVERKGPAPSDPMYKKLCLESWVCFNCGTLNDGGEVFCKKCNLTRPAPEGVPEYYANVENQWWRCTYCGEINNGKDKRCRRCDKR